jgi:hypothetical protein
MPDISKIDNDALAQLLVDEIRDLTEDGAGLPCIFSAVEAFTLLSLLQLALRHPGLHGYTRDFATRLAKDLESRLSVTPAIRESVRRGWNPEFDTEREIHD